MNDQLLAVDMDDTVLNSKKEIMPKTEDAIRNALDQGYEVLFSTGRNTVEIREQKMISDVRSILTTSPRHTDKKSARKSTKAKAKPAIPYDTMREKFNRPVPEQSQRSHEKYFRENKMEKHWEPVLFLRSCLCSGFMFERMKI